MRLGARRDGTITAIDADAVIAMGQGGWVFPVLIPARTLYRCADVRALTFPVKTNLRAQNAFRAPGVMEGTTAFEQAIDELALALDLDPLELRRRNHADVDQVSGLPYSSKQLLACYDRAAELAGWDARERAPRATGRRAAARHGMRDPDLVGRRRAAVACDRPARRGGQRLVVTGIQDIGTGTLTGAQIVAAEELGLPLDHVRVVGGDTAPNVYGPVAGAPRRRRRCCRPFGRPRQRCARRCSSSPATCSRSRSATSRFAMAGFARATGRSTPT